MKRIVNMKLIILLASIAISQGAYAQEKITHNENTKQELINLSKTKWQWMADRNTDSLNDLFHKEAVFVHMGATMNKEQKINTIKSGGIQYKHTEIQETSIRFVDNTDKKQII